MEDPSPNKGSGEACWTRENYPERVLAHVKNGGSAFQIGKEDDKNWFVRWVLSRKEKLICLHCMRKAWQTQETVSKLVFLEVRIPTMHTCTSLCF